MAGWDVVNAFLLTKLPDVPGIGSVYDGPLTTSAPPQSLVVVGDDGAGAAGSYAQDYDDVSTFVSEQGEVLCWFAAQSGNTDLAALRVTVRGWVDALTALLRADKTLAGGLRQGSTVAVTRVDMTQKQTKQGAAVTATVAVGYQTRL